MRPGGPPTASVRTRHEPGTEPSLPGRYGDAVSTRSATPWGAAVVVEEVVVPQRAGAKRFSSVVQLLEVEGGERLVRFAYTTSGTARRGPVTLRARDVQRLAEALEAAPGLREALAPVR